MQAAVQAILVLGLVGVVGAVSHNVEEIQDCVADNAPEQSSIQTVLLRSHDRGGEVTDTRAKIYWKHSGEEEDRVALHVSEPASRRGSAVLLVRDDGDTSIWAYMPAIARVRRVTEHSVQGAMFGTDISYEDFERLQWMVKAADAQRIDDRTLDGREVYVVEERPDPDGDSAYERIVTLIDKERCLALRTELFERGENLRKVITTPEESIRKESCGWIPRVVRIEDLVDGTKTEIVIEKFEADVPFHDSKVSTSALGKNEF